MMLRACYAFLLAIFLASMGPGLAQAQTCSATIADVDFGAPSLLSAAPTDAIATVTVTCTGIPFLTTVKMCASIGDGSGGSSGSGRLMRGPGGILLSYQLFQDASRTQAWGALDETQLGTVPLLTIGNGFSSAGTATTRIYARLFGGQVLAASGTYLSTFAGAETAFRYASAFIGSSVGCTGYLGSYVVRPEFDVTARPPAGCGLTTTDLVFPTTGVLRSAVRGEARINVACTSGTKYSISLDNGTSGTSPTARKLTGTGGSVTYGLYRDSARLTAWGTAAAGLAVSGAGTGNEQAFTVHGLVPAQTTPPPGLYSDRIVVTVAY